MRSSFRLRLACVLALVITAMAAATGCDDHRYDTVQQQSYLMNAQDFALDTVAGLVESNQVANAQMLQDRINDPASGINNVDIDRDGQIDLILVRETVSGFGRTFEFLAQPSGNPGGQGQLVANIVFSDASGQRTYVATYPSYVAGYHQYSYQGTLAPSLALYGWLSTPHLLWMPVRTNYAFYRPRPIVTSSVLTQIRTRYVTTTRVSPVRAVPQPMRNEPIARSAGTGYAAPQQPQAPAPSVGRVQSGYRMPAPAPSSSPNLGDRRGALSPFAVTNTAANAREGTGFAAPTVGARPMMAPVPANPAPTPPNPWPTVNRAPATAPMAAPQGTRFGQAPSAPMATNPANAFRPNPTPPAPPPNPWLRNTAPAATQVFTTRQPSVPVPAAAPMARPTATPTAWPRATTATPSAFPTRSPSPASTGFTTRTGSSTRWPR